MGASYENLRDIMQMNLSFKFTTEQMKPDGTILIFREK